MSRRVFARGSGWRGGGGSRFLVCQSYLRRVLHFTLLSGESWPSCLLVFREKFMFIVLFYSEFMVIALLVASAFAARKRGS